MSKQQHEYIEHIDIPATIPTPMYRYQSHGGSNKNRDVLVHYPGFTQELKLDALNTLRDDIIKTREKFVYPTVFVNFVKRITYIPKNKLVIFSDDDLFKLRIWSNQVRGCNNANELKSVEYLTYRIGERIMAYFSLYDTKENKEVNNN